MKNELNQTTAYSSRSQRSLVEEDDLLAKRAKVDTLISSTEGKIKKLEEDKARQLSRGVAGAPGLGQVVLSQILLELEDNGRLLAAYREQRDSIGAAIAQMIPDLDVLQARAKEQLQVAQLASERLEKDKQINQCVASLREALQERAALTAGMKESSGPLDFTPYDDFFDVQRFEELLASLPGELLATSEAWTARFLGRKEGTKSYIVRDSLLVIPETLASHGVYHFGDSIELLEGSARELLREDRPAPTSSAPWRYAPPSIKTVEAWEACSASAGAQGVTVEQILLWDDWQLDTRAKKGFVYGGKVVPLTEDQGERVTVKVRAKATIHANEDEYRKGDVFDLYTYKWNVFEMCESGVIERP